MENSNTQTTVDHKLVEVINASNELKTKLEAKLPCADLVIRIHESIRASPHLAFNLSDEHVGVLVAGISVIQAKQILQGTKPPKSKIDTTNMAF